MSETICQCQCGQTKFTLLGEPLMRVVCHCKTCQEYNQSAFADILVFRSKDVSLPKDNNVEFKSYQSPPMVQRGKCLNCLKPAIELFNMPLFPKLTMVPSENIPEDFDLPITSFHMFYHRRVNDIDDKLPKKNGFISSQMAFMWKLFGVMAFGRK